MLTTTLAVVALAGALSTGASPSPSWQSDYAQAMSVASAERKPMAVFIGPAARKPGQMITDGTISEEAAKLLRDSYVCLYLDTDTTSGKEMADRFALSEGLIISSPGGSVQALRHNGAVVSAELTKQLGQYAKAGQPATTVSTGIGSRAVGVFVGGCANGQCYPNSGTAVGGYYYPAGTVYSGVYSNPFGGSCATGNCPLQR